MEMSLPKQSATFFSCLLLPKELLSQVSEFLHVVIAHLIHHSGLVLFKLFLKPFDLECLLSEEFPELLTGESLTLLPWRSA